MSLVTASKLNKLWREDIDPLKSLLDDIEEETHQYVESEMNAHIILDRWGNPMPQRSKLVFTNQPGKDKSQAEITVIGALPFSGTMNVPRINNLIYNGSIQTPDINYNADILQISGDTSARNVGTYTVTFHIKNADDYTWSDGTIEDKIVEWKITKLQVQIPTVFGNFIYDGTPKTATISGWNEDFVSIRGLTATECGIHNVVCSLKESTNTEWTDGTIADKTCPWVIEKLGVQIPTVTSDLVYNGQSQSPTIDYHGNESLINLVGGGSGTDAGTYYAEFSLKDPDNYNWTDGTNGIQRVQWSIDKLGIPLVTTEGNLVYNGSGQSPTWVNYDSSKMDISTDPLSVTSAINAGIYTTIFVLKNNYKWTINRNHSVDAESDLVVEWVINKAPGFIQVNKNFVTIAEEYSTFIEVTNQSGNVSCETSNICELEIDEEDNNIIHISYLSIGQDSVTLTTSESNNYLSASIVIHVSSIIPKRMSLIIDKSSGTGTYTYADDAVGMSPGSSQWDTYFGYYPCVIKDGVEIGKVNPNDFTKYTNGTSIPQEVGYDVMICFPKKYISIIHNNANSVKVSILDLPIDDNESMYGDPFYFYSEEKDCVYIGAYLANLETINGKSCLGSRSGTNILSYDSTLNASRNNFSTRAVNKGSNYRILTYSLQTYIHIMQLIKYCGYSTSNGLSLSMMRLTSTNGSCDMYGLNHTITQPNDIEACVKFFGMEQLSDGTVLDDILVESYAGKVQQGSIHKVRAATLSFQQKGIGTMFNTRPAWLGLLSDNTTYLEPGNSNRLCSYSGIRMVRYQSSNYYSRLIYFPQST